MDIPMNVEVRCAGQSCGKSAALVMNPITEAVTHLVVKEMHQPHAERLVPIDEVIKTTSEIIELRCTAGELATIERFTDVHFIKVKTPRYTSIGAGMYAFPYVIPDPKSKWVSVEEEHVPPHELAVRRHAKVRATDGHIGKVDEFLVDPETCHITHLVMREGHLWGQKDVVIPIASIEHYEEDTVYLKLNKEEVEKLPTVPIHRGILP
jgi:hypothetical protein